MIILPKLIYIFNAIPVTIPAVLFCRNSKADLNIQRTQNRQNNLKQKDKTGVFNFKTYNKATVIKTVILT